MRPRATLRRRASATISATTATTRANNSKQRQKKTSPTALPPPTATSNNNSGSITCSNSTHNPTSHHRQHLLQQRHEHYHQHYHQPLRQRHPHPRHYHRSPHDCFNIPPAPHYQLQLTAGGGKQSPRTPPSPTPSRSEPSSSPGVILPEGSPAGAVPETLYSATVSYAQAVDKAGGACLRASRNRSQLLLCGGLSQRPKLFFSERMLSGGCLSCPRMRPARSFQNLFFFLRQSGGGSGVGKW